jgi:hypothetical protein
MTLRLSPPEVYPEYVSLKKLSNLAHPGLRVFPRFPISGTQEIRLGGG